MESMLNLHWDIVALFTLATIAILVLYLRIEKKARRLSFFFLVLPVCFGMYTLSRWRQQLPELMTGMINGGVLYLIWHMLYGRRIPLPSSDNIKVWEQDD
jgi:predicted membrane channel-forming protein YqfA (hemolysin III family)